MNEEKILKATYPGELKIGDVIIKCAVLEDGKTRVITQRSVYSAMGRSGSTGGLKRKNGAQDLPRILAASNLTPYISDELRCAVTPIRFKPKTGGKPAYGYRAEILPEICNVYLEAREANVLTPLQEKIAAQCEILVRGFARIGIIALIDEATGFQHDRDREALQAILDKYLRDQVLAKWAKTFPDQFYEHLFKLKGWQYRPLSVKRPGVVGHWTNDVVYARLAPGVLKALREKNPKDHKGRRRHKLFQWLTEDYGHPALKQHLSNVIFLMRAHPSWQGFYRALQRAAPKYGDRFLPHVHDDVDE